MNSNARRRCLPLAEPVLLADRCCSLTVRLSEIHRHWFALRDLTIPSSAHTDNGSVRCGRIAMTAAPMMAGVDLRHPRH